MTCNRCKKRYGSRAQRCPHCGHVNQASGVFQTSTVLVSTSGSAGVYRSVDEMPGPLRTRLIRSTNGANSATILIADRRGRQEIARAMRNLPGGAQRRLKRAMQGDDAPVGLHAWLTPVRRWTILALVAVLALSAITVVFTRAW